MSVAGVCRVCGCTDSQPCILDPEGVSVAIDDGSTTMPLGHTTCSWIEPDLCSGCVKDKAPAMLFDGDGNPIGRAP